MFSIIQVSWLWKECSVRGIADSTVNLRKKRHSDPDEKVMYVAFRQQNVKWVISLEGKH